MKKAIFLYSLFLVIILSDSIKAQQYYPFQTDTAKWSVYSSLNPWGGSFQEDTFHFFINGDTLINTIFYSKVYSSIAYYSETIDTLNAVYLGGLREDINKHIYYKPGELNQNFSYQCYINNSTLDEFLLYRFDLDSGDSFYLNEFTYYDLTVVNIDSVLVDSIYRKRYNLLTPLGFDYDYWVEGIGSMWSLFGPLCTQFEGWDYLMCYEDPSTLYYGEYNESERCTHFIVGLSEQNMPMIQLYPNPTNKLINIVIENGEIINQVNIYSLMGQLVSQEKGEIHKVDISIFKQGVYIIELISNNNRFRTKLIKK